VQPQPVEAGEEPSSLADALRASLAAAKSGRLGAEDGTDTAKGKAGSKKSGKAAASAESGEDKPAQRRTRKAS
jgi:hypothetical protein